MNDDVASAHFIASSELSDSCLYEVQCPKDHRSYVILQQQKFELLFDIGACALLDGYHREAVSSFTSSLERFHEFFIRASFIQSENSLSEFDVAWREMAKHSERQLGAFVATYLRECGSAPPLLSQNSIKFRNNVIHQGKIPERSEAINYGNAVLSNIQPALLVAKRKFPKGVEQLTASHLAGAHQKLPPGAKAATSCMPTILSLSRDDIADSDQTLEQALSKLGIWNWRF
jgi:hypothetical protein